MSIANTFTHRNLDEKLIQLIKQHPILYDVNHSRYKKSNEREVVWHKIGDALKRTASECKARWINIRDTNRRIIRETMRHPGRPLYRYYKLLEFMRPFYRDISIQNFDLNSNDAGQDDNDDNNAEFHSENEEVELEGEGDPLVYNSDNGSDYVESGGESNEEEINYTVNTKTVNKRRIHTETVKDKRIKKEKNKVASAAANTSSSKEPNMLRELDPADTLDAFLLSIGATMKKFSPYHLNQTKSKIFNIVQQHELQQIMKEPLTENSHYISET